MVNIALYSSKAEIRVPVGGGWWWCKPIIVSNPQPSYFGLLLGWVAVAWLGFGDMTIYFFPTFFKQLLTSLVKECLVSSSKINYEILE